MSDKNLDHEDLLEAQGAFVDEDELSSAWKESYEKYLDDLYEKDRLQMGRRRRGQNVS